MIVIHVYLLARVVTIGKMKNDNILELSSNIIQGTTDAIKEIDQTIRKSEFRKMIVALLEKARGDAEQIVKEVEKGNGNECVQKEDVLK